MQLNSAKICFYSHKVKKSRIRETPNLSTNADSSTVTFYLLVSLKGLIYFFLPPPRGFFSQIFSSFFCSYSGNKEEWQRGSAEARFFSLKVLLSRTRRMFLQTVVLPFCIDATIPTNTTIRPPPKKNPQKNNPFQI